MWTNDVTAFPKGSGPAVNDLETVYREHNLEAQVGSVPNHDGITAPVLSSGHQRLNRAAFARFLHAAQSLPKPRLDRIKLAAAVPKLPCLPLHEFLPCHCNKRR